MNPSLPPWLQIFAGLNLAGPSMQLGGGNFSTAGTMSGQNMGSMADFTGLNDALGIMDGSSASQPYGPGSPTSPSLPQSSNDLIRSLLGSLLGMGNY